MLDSIEFPTSATRAQQLGIDLDCDPQGRPDNALGQVVAFVAANVDVDLQSEIDQLVDAGEILHLVQISATALDDADSVGVAVLHGIDTDMDPSDNFSGNETFAVDESRGRGSLSGRIREGRLTAEFGITPIAVTFPGVGESFVVPLHGSRIEIFLSDSGVTGRIGGAVVDADVQSVVIPIFREGLQRIVDRDCDVDGCIAGSRGELLLDLFDTDMDGVITSEELRGSDLVGNLLSPDVDLYDETGTFNPRSDEVKDALSIGLGFTAVGASF